MRKIVVFLSLIVSLSVSAQQYVPVDSKSAVAFVIKNMGMDVDGTFKGLEGSINFNPQNLDKSGFFVTVNAGTVNTGISNRDNHLQQAEFFDVANFPKITISSSKVEHKDGNNYTAQANVKIKDKVRPITIDFVAVPENGTYSFKGSFTLNRKDFGLGGNSMTMANNVKVNLTIATKKK